MQDHLVGWLGLTIFVVAVLFTVAADFFRQRDATAATTPKTGSQRPGGRVFWLTVASLVLAVVAGVATVVRMVTLA